MTDKPRGTCVHCGRSFQLNKDGTVRHHGDKLASAARGTYCCRGVGEFPEEHEYAAPDLSAKEHQKFMADLEAQLSSVDMIRQIAREQGFSA